MKGRYAELIDELASSTNPIIRYKAQRHLLDEDPTSGDMRKQRRSIAESPIARGLLADLRDADPKTRSGTATIYESLKHLSDIYYPPGDDSLIPFRDHVHEWLKELESAYDGPLLIRGKHRVHGSFHGNAIYSSIVLGMCDERTDELCANLLRYQWPGGGWNCNKKPNTKGPTIVHTAYGMRGLDCYRSRKDSAELRQTVDSAAEVILERRVYLSRSTGNPLRPVYAKMTYPYPRLYNFMAGAHILARAGFAADERCGDALDLLESKFIDGQGWAMERKLFHHNRTRDGHTNVYWEKETLGEANLFLTVDALEILKVAGRLD